MAEESVKKEKKTLDLKKGGVIWVVWNYVEAALLLVAGILAIVFSNNKDLHNTILIIVGAFLIVGGFLKILMNFLPVLSAVDKAKLSYDMVIGGAFELALGVTLVAMPSAAGETIVQFLSTFIAIILIVAGASFLMFAIGFIVDKLFGLAMPILEIVLSLGLIALGIVVLVYMNNADVFYQVVLIITGVIMALAGLALLVETTRVMIASNKAKKAVKEAAADEKKDEQVVETIDATSKPSEEKKDEEPKAIENKPEDKKDDNVVDASSSDKK